MVLPRIRTVNLDDPAFRETTDAKTDIKAKRAGRDRLDVNGRSRCPSFVTEPLPNAFSIWPMAASTPLTSQYFVLHLRVHHDSSHFVLLLAQPPEPVYFEFGPFRIPFILEFPAEIRDEDPRQSAPPSCGRVYVLT